MGSSKQLLALPAMLAIFTACGVERNSSALNDTTTNNQTRSVEARNCEVAKIPSWTFYDYCACVDVMSEDDIDDSILGEGAAKSMKILKKSLESKAQAILQLPQLAGYENHVCAASGSIFELRTGNTLPNKMRKFAEDAVQNKTLDSKVIERKIALAGTGFTSPQPLVHLGKNKTSIGSIDLSYNELEEAFFEPLQAIDWMARFSILDIDLSNNNLKTTKAIDFKPNISGAVTAMVNSVDLAYNDIEAFEAWQSGVTIGGLAYLNLSHNPNFKAVATVDGKLVNLGQSIRKIIKDKTELFLDLSYTATDELMFNDTTRVFSGIVLDGLTFKENARLGLRMPNFPGWITAEGSKNLGGVLKIDSSPVTDAEARPVSYLNVDKASGLGNLEFLRDQAGKLPAKVQYLSAVGSDFHSFTSSPLDLSSVEFFAVDGSEIQALSETFDSLLYASSTGIQDAQYLQTSKSLKGAVINTGSTCATQVDVKCSAQAYDGTSQLVAAGISDYVEDFCKTTMGANSCLDAAKKIIESERQATVSDEQLDSALNDYIANWCQTTFGKSCEMASNLAPKKVKE